MSRSRSFSWLAGLTVVLLETCRVTQATAQATTNQFVAVSVSGDVSALTAAGDVYSTASRERPFVWQYAGNVFASAGHGPDSQHFVGLAREWALTQGGDAYTGGGGSWSYWGNIPAASGQPSGGQEFVGISFSGVGDPVFVALTSGGDTYRLDLSTSSWTCPSWCFAGDVFGTTSVPRASWGVLKARYR